MRSHQHLPAQLFTGCEEGRDDEEDCDSPRLSSCCWWRPAVKPHECAELKLGAPNAVGSGGARLRVLREMERLALVGPEGLRDLRHKLVSYSSGDFWAPAGGISKEATDIPPVITILLVGFSGAGKTSLVNLMYSVLGRSGLLPFAQSSSGRSCKSASMEEHNVMRSTGSGFCVYDTRGFEYERVEESLVELSVWMSQGVHHNQLCPTIGDQNSPRSKYKRRKVNCAMVVANVAEIYGALKRKDFKPLEATKRLFSSPPLRQCNEHDPILILTHGDALPAEERIEARLKICEYIGASETAGVYDVVCRTEYGFLAEESDPINAYAATEAVYRALLISDGSHLPRTSFLDWVLLFLSWLMCFLADFFTLLAQLFAKLGQRDLKFNL